MTAKHLAALIRELQHVEAWHIHGIDEVTGELLEGEQVDAAVLVDQLVIHDVGLHEQWQLASAQVGSWGMRAARAQRVFEIADRAYRTWRERTAWSLRKKPDDPETAKGWKKPTEKEIEGTYRLDPEYAKHWLKLERLREAWNKTEAAHEAFKAKCRALEKTYFRDREGNEYQTA